MDFIQTSNKQVDKFGPGKHGFSAGNPAGGVPATFLSPDWSDGVQQEHINLIEGAGLVASGADLTQVRQAVKRLTGGNVTTVNFAVSPFALTADHAGMVLVDATAGNVVINLPPANVLVGLPYVFRRVDTTANTVTVNRAGADSIDEGGASFALTSKAIQQVRSNGATTWSTVAPVAATQAETDAGTDDAKFVTPLKLRSGFAISLSSSGYIKLPAWLGGLVIEWGNVATLTTGDVTVTFPLAFPAAARSVLSVVTTGAGSVANFSALGGVSATAVPVGAYDAAGARVSATVYWFAVGN